MTQLMYIMAGDNVKLMTSMTKVVLKVPAWMANLWLWTGVVLYWLVMAVTAMIEIWICWKIVNFLFECLLEGAGRIYRWLKN